ncbi:MAG: DEAD/DEAH box helicase [Gammaproteobacteria bacterium]
MLGQLQKTFGAPLFDAAERLVDLGCVSEVRVLQAGAVVTGIAATDSPSGNAVGQRRTIHRVYVQQRNRTLSDGPSIEGECSCGGRDPCVHVAAVLIAAAKSESPVPLAASRGGAGAGAAGVSASVESPQSRAVGGLAPRGVSGQRLFYLLEGISGRFRFSIWVGQLAAGRAEIETDSAHIFTPRTLINGDGSGRDTSSVFPRYVDAQDKEILKTIPLQNIDGPWELRGAPGGDLLRRLTATGRAFWQSLQGKPMRTGGPQRATFAWEFLPDGGQRLRCDSERPWNVILDVEPAVYVDTAAGEWGPLELPCAQSFLREYWHQPPIAPEDVETTNAHIARDIGAPRFPRLRSMPVRRQPFDSLRAKLVLTAGPATALYFIYNGLEVDSRRLALGQDVVRQMAGEALYQIDRDTVAELRLIERLESAFGGRSPGRHATGSVGRESWLAFVMQAVPVLQAEGWEILAQDDFPYRVAAADKWYGELLRPGEVQQGLDTGELPAQEGDGALPRANDNSRNSRAGMPPLPEGARSRRRGSEREHDWFDLRLGVVVDGIPVNLLPVLASYLQATADHSVANRLIDDAPYCRVDEQLLVRMDDGRYVPVSLERIQRIADTLVELYDRGGLNPDQALSLPASHASRLVELADGSDGPALRAQDASLLTLVGELTDFRREQPQLSAPAGFRATLRPYQEEGLGWLQFLRRHRLGGILADDMGLGKTVQTLAHLSLEREQGRLRKPTLIVAPVSVIGNWAHEIRRFAPELNLVILHGARRRESYSAISQADIVVTGYPLLVLDSEILLEREFSYVILDEAQTIKNPRAKVSQVARQLRAEHRLCLTGTPMENHLGELWSLFDFVQPGLLGDEKQFQRQYRTPIEKNNDSQRFQALIRRIAPFVLRRTKDAVAKDLPPKTQIVESIVLDERQRDFYDGIRLAMHRHVREIIEAQGIGRSHITVLDALLKLRQACCDPRLVGKDPETQSVPSAKLDWLVTVLPELVAEGRRILLFSQFTSMLALIEAALKELEIPYCLLTGDTQHREVVVERFQSGQVPLFLISLKAGGTGLNLTAADTVIHYDPWWNPAAEAQATDRAHRIGQDKPVFVYKLIAEGTVEEKIMQLQADKQALASQLYSDANAALPSQLTTADLESLFAP